MSKSKKVALFIAISTLLATSIPHEVASAQSGKILKAITKRARNKEKRKYDRPLSVKRKEAGTRKSLIKGSRNGDGNSGRHSEKRGAR
jgi:hypothetical protein